MRSSLALTLVAACMPAHAQAKPRTGYVSLQRQVKSVGCLQPKTKAMVAHLTARIGPVEITSTCGGRHARHSQHYRGGAVDFRPQRASVAAALAALRAMPEVGGIGSYSGDLIHADIGERRMAWHGTARHRTAHRHHQARFAYGLRVRRAGAA